MLLNGARITLLVSQFFKIEFWVESSMCSVNISLSRSEGRWLDSFSKAGDEDMPSGSLWMRPSLLRP